MSGMRTFSLLVVCVALCVGRALAGESGVAYTYQALSGLGSAEIHLERVYCHDHFSMSGEPTAFALICAPNIPPTNSKEKLNDHNLLSASGLQMHATRVGDHAVAVVMDAQRIQVPIAFGNPEEEVVRYGLECIRLTAMFTRVAKYTVKIEAPDRLTSKVQAMLEQFEKHDKTKPFASHPGS